MPRPPVTDKISAATSSQAGGAAILSLSRGVCREWKVGLEHPIDVSLEISPELFSDEMEEIGLDESRWNSVIWNIQQSISGLGKIFDSI